MEAHLVNLIAALALALTPATAVTSYEDLVCAPQHVWPCGQALSVMECESTNNPRAYKAGNYGLFQINQIHGARVGWDLDLLYDPETNVRIAHDLYRASGWTPWRYCSRGF